MLAILPDIHVYKHTFMSYNSTSLHDTIEYSFLQSLLKKYKNISFYPFAWGPFWLQPSACFLIQDAKKKKKNMLALHAMSLEYM